MPRGYRHIIIAAVRWLILGNANQAQHNHNGSRNQATAKQSASSRKSLAPKEYQPKCNQPADGNEADICTSLRQTKAAEQANSISTKRLWLNEIGIVAVILTMGPTAWAAWCTGRAATAAATANSHAKGIAEHQLRPYVFIKSVEFETSKIRIPENLRSVSKGAKYHKSLTGRISYEYKNTGSTPAKNVRVAARAEIIPR